MMNELFYTYPKWMCPVEEVWSWALFCPLSGVLQTRHTESEISDIKWPENKLKLGVQ